MESRFCKSIDKRITLSDKCQFGMENGPCEVGEERHSTGVFKAVTTIEIKSRGRQRDSLSLLKDGLDTACVDYNVTCRRFRQSGFTEALG